jgi:allantoin racemase
MRLHLVNPNSTVSMTEKIAAAARHAAAPATEIFATTSQSGPVSIEGYYDGAAAVHGLLDQIETCETGKADGGIDAHVIACFDDTGLDAARCLANAPVFGIGEAAYHVACLVAQRFSVITTLSRSIPVLEQNLVRYGLATRCGRVRASDLPVLALEDPGSGARERISAEIEQALSQDRADAIVLGCAGMADLCADLASRHQVPVIEGVSAAVRLAEAIVGLGLSTSKIGGWAFPRVKR